jgi:hypothetical protein
MANLALICFNKSSSYGFRGFLPQLPQLKPKKVSFFFKVGELEWTNSDLRWLFL